MIFVYNRRQKKGIDMRDFSKIKNVIIKIGSSSLCDDKGNIDTKIILEFIQQISAIHEMGIQVTLVSSGAIATGMREMRMRKRPDTIPEKQALAAIGQAALMRIYEQLFDLFHLKTAQILLNQGDFDDRNRVLNFHNTLESLYKYKVIPIVNENDTLAFEEMKIGDNDTLAALMVPVANADLVILVSDVDGLYTANPQTHPDAKLISEVSEVNADIEQMGGDAISTVGTGGMYTKIRAAKICNAYGCDMAIVNGNRPKNIVDLLQGKEVGTLFNGQTGKNLHARQHWIKYQTSPKGCIVVDEGCKKALRKHKSLLPKGIVSVSGDFSMSSVVEVKDQNGKNIARGIVYYSKEEIDRIKQRDTKEIESILGYKDYDVVIHANNMVLM